MALRFSCVYLKSAFPLKTLVSTNFNLKNSFRRAMSSPSVDNELTQAVRKIVPSMTASHYKGQCGRIGVIGGCKEYTGAPYFAGISALKVGADLSHIFCTQAAAPVIKSYSPELIVHPVLDVNNAVDEILLWLPRLHALVIGPGLGREDAIFAVVREVIYKAKEQSLPLVIDADGLFLVTQTPEIIYAYEKTILTPNRMELSRLYEKVMSAKPPASLLPSDVQSLATELGGVTIVSKGAVDIITNGGSTLLCSARGSHRRCGGQGDLLSGSLGTFVHWSLLAKKAEQDHGTITGDDGNVVTSYDANVIAAYAACFLTRECNRVAFETHKRSMTTTDMIAHIGKVFDSHFETE